MQGRRVPFRPGFPGGFGGVNRGQPGDYCKVPPGIDPRPGQIWYLIDPTDTCGALTPEHHQIVEHEDGTITVSPSIAMQHGQGWHGFLEHGVWRSV